MSVEERARNAVKMAMRSGRLVRGLCVFGEGCEGPVEAHHDDYSQPLRIWWVCAGHHADITWRGLMLPAGAEPARIPPPRGKMSPGISPEAFAYSGDSSRGAQLRRYWQSKKLAAK